MSLLLEALKRAADAKRQQEEERIYQRTGQRPVISDEMLAELDEPEVAEGASQGEELEPPVPPAPVDEEAYRPPLSHAEAVAGVGEDHPDSQRVAQSVFDSKTPFAGERIRRVLLVTGALVAVTGALGLGGYAYHQKRDDLLRMELDDVRSARHRPATPAPSPPPSPTATTGSTLPPRPAQEAAPIAEAAPAPPMRTEPAPEIETRSAVDPSPPVAAGEAAPVDSPVGEPLADSRQTPASGNEVSIVRNATRAKIAAALAAGYKAFHDGEPGAARIHYARALQLDEHNRDALLGLAAIAVQEGDSQRAAEMYRALLRKNPRDSVAVAALSSLPDSGSARNRESELKVLLQKNPRAAELHFALGALYSKEQRWAEAQAAFFEAHKRDSENPDFLFNLAVSLDHLNKAAAAAQYYAAALRAADGRAASFDVDAARDRLRTLREARSGEG